MERQAVKVTKISQRDDLRTFANVTDCCAGERVRTVPISLLVVHSFSLLYLQYNYKIVFNISEYITYAVKSRTTKRVKSVKNTGTCLPIH